MPADVPPWTHLARFAAATAVFTLAAWATLTLTRVSEGIASIWIANALLLGYALRRPGALPPLLAAAVTGTALVSVLVGRPFAFGLLAGVCNAIEMGLIHAAFRRFGLRPGKPLTDRGLLVFVGIALVAAPAATGLLGATLAASQTGAPWPELFLNWWLSDALGLFVVLPLLWAYTRTDARRILIGRAALDFWAFSVLAAGVTVLALTQLERGFVVMPLPLLLLAVRTGVLGTALGSLQMIGVALVVVLAQHRGALPVPGPASAGLAVSDVWLYACMSAAGPLLVAFMTGQRNAERTHALALGERLRVLADNLPAYIAELGPDLRYRYANARYRTWLGRPDEPILGRRPTEVIGAEAAAGLAPYMARALDGEPQRFEFDLPAGPRIEVHYEPLPQSGGFVLMGQDISWRRDAERRFRHLLESAPDAMVVLDRATRRIVLVNGQVERTFGHPRETLLGQPFDRLLAQPERLGGDVIDAHLAARDGGAVLEIAGLRHDGSVFPAEAVFGRLQGEGSELVAAIRDVSTRRRTERALHEERERAQVTLNSIGDAVITYGTDGRVTSLNPVAETLTGWPAADALGRPYAEVVRLHDPDTGRALPADGTRPGDAADAGTGLGAVLHRRDGRELFVEESDSPIRDSDGEVIGGVTVLRDISEAHAMRQRMLHLARHDYLTGLPNRVLLEERLRQALARVDEGAHGALLFVDLDLFKHINDSLGHHAGDHVLQAVAGRLVDAVRPDDTVSRQGGDEFVLLLRGVDRATAARVATELIRVVEAPIEFEDRPLHLSASIGVALFPDDSRDFNTLIQQADTALYHAKHAGRGRCSLFTPAMSERASQRHRLETELRAGVAAGHLFLEYQPKVRLPAQRILGLEALVRWRSADGRDVQPLEFIPIAEETGLIASIDEWVLREACRQNKAWLDAGIARVPVAVNVSLARLAPERLIGHLRRVLEETGLPPELLELEFTESQMLGQHERAAQLVEDIRGLGVRLAVDDFGTGYSSLSYLANYRFDTIKVDRSFVEGLPGDVERAAVVQAILGIARTLGCHVVAEGVETAEQADALAGLGCSEMQGYRFGRPAGNGEIEALLRAGTVRTRPAARVAH